jgi:(R,R)-butanediol dehydrogenase/meso-butanediol dehydrogenase/diacetyl reductase
MRAARWYQAGDVRVEEVPALGPPPVGMVDVAVARCGICGTDVGEFRNGPFLIRNGTHPLTGQGPPVTLGHEFSGQVTACGEGVATEPGTRVTADACWRCGQCPACQRGDYHLCRFGGSIGLASDGAFAPMVRVPAYTLVPLPDNVDDAKAALTEPLAVGLHALDRGRTAAGDQVLILGFGAIGAAAALVAVAIGARPIVVEVLPARRVLAQRLGLEVLEGGDELPRRLRRLTGRLGVDVVLECTGVGALVGEAVSCADRGGRIVLIGMGTKTASIDPSALTLYERSLAGSLGYRHDLPRVVALMSAGSLDPTPLIGETIGLDDVPETMRRLATDPGGLIKVLVDPS